MKKILIALAIFMSFIAFSQADDAIIKDDGCVDKEIFEKDWRKYSDIDEIIPLQSRSLEAQQVAAIEKEVAELQEEIGDLMASSSKNKDLHLKILEGQIAEDRLKKREWEEKEKARVFERLNKDCLELMGF